MEVSVIIPVYNAEKFIRKSIESCLQLKEVKEIIVIDDGFNDNAKKIVEMLARQHTIIKLYEHPNNANKGAGASRNLGIEKATKEYIAFLDADDFYLPNRFHKDKEIFSVNPDADGSHNSIDCFFYSTKAKDNYLTHFSSTVTSVQSSANPKPETLFRGLIGMIPNHGYFHLNGLTVKRKFLLKSKICFPEIAVHQDTVFIFQLAYYGRLYPSELNRPVAMRGVHEENRIISNYSLEKRKQYAKRYYMWNLLFEWAKDENIGNKELRHFKRLYTLYKMLSKKKPKIYHILVLGLTDIRLLINPYYREMIINNYKKTHTT